MQTLLTATMAETLRATPSTTNDSHSALHPHEVPRKIGYRIPALSIADFRARTAEKEQPSAALEHDVRGL
jgi:hypothetical protein